MIQRQPSTPCRQLGNVAAVCQPAARTVERVRQGQPSDLETPGFPDGCPARSSTRRTAVPLRTGTEVDLATPLPVSETRQTAPDPTPAEAPETVPAQEEELP